MNEIAKKILAHHGIDPEAFEQPQVIELIKNPLSDIWTTVYTHSDELFSTPSIFCCFVELSHRDHILDGCNWLKHPDSFTPGFSESGNSVQFEPSNYDGFHFIIAEQYFYSLNEAQLHLNQEFALLFELFRGNDGNYYSIDDCGRREMVVEFLESQVNIKTKFLIRYMSARQLLFVQFIDSRVSTPGHYPFNAELIDTESDTGSNYTYTRWFQGKEDENYLHSMIHARSFVEPKPVTECGLWPYDKGNESYPEFIVRELPDGSFERYTCEESKLANYFGANPGAPHYLTPIYFNPAVLDKYRKDKLFDVTEHRITCGSQWSIAIDNVKPSRVMVYLGDLGRDLPESERLHFLSHEISPADQCISETVFANDFLNCWSDSNGPIGKLLKQRCELNESWKESFGVPLYRELHRDELDIPKRIRIPASSGDEEFDTVILNLTKYLIDYIDEPQFSSYKKGGSINNLEAFLHEKGIQIDLSPLRDLQSIRSTSMAHSKGKKYEKLVGSVITDNHASDVLSLVERLTAMMGDLASCV